jgi:membrane associated rhomboid family serine protease
MGYQDRPYYRDEMSRSPLSRLHGHSVVTWLLVINVAVFIIDSIVTGSQRAGGISPTEWGHYSFARVFGELQLWRVGTYQFLHADLLHLLFNMMALFFMGPLMEGWWGPRRFLAFYLLCGLSGAVVFSVLGFVPGLLEGVGTGSRLVGASGAIYGILIGAAMVFPRLEVSLLFPPVRVKLRTLALVLMGFIFLSLLAGSRGAASDAAHLGGAVLGAVLVRWPGLLDFVNHLSLPQVSRWRQKRRQKQVQKNQQRLDALEGEVDRILDKVNREGLQALSRREKRTLQEATESKRRS